MNNIVKKILMVPLKGANIIAGGNAVDALKQRGSPLMRNLAKKLPTVDNKIKNRLLQYGTHEDRKIYKKERLKTHLGRAVALTGGLAYLRSKPKPVHYMEYPYD